MNPLDQPLSFLREQEALLYLFCAAATVSCFLFRRSEWITVVWFPSLLVTGGYSLWLFLYMLSQSGDHSPDAGYLAMGFMFGALFYWPLPVTAILLLVAYPRREAWRFPYVFLGIVSAVAVPLLVCSAFHLTRQPVPFAVMDSNGSALQGVAFRVLGDPSPAAFTDSTGKLLGHMEHGRDLIGTFSADGYFIHRVSINLAGSNLHVGHSLPKPGSRYETVNSSELYPLSRSVEVRIVMIRNPTQ